MKLSQKHLKTLSSDAIALLIPTKIKAPQAVAYDFDKASTQAPDFDDDLDCDSNDESEEDSQDCDSAEEFEE